jgi:hypothetical protein
VDLIDMSVCVLHDWDAFCMIVGEDQKPLTYCLTNHGRQERPRQDKGSEKNPACFPSNPSRVPYEKDIAVHYSK